MAHASRSRRTPRVSGDERERAILETFERLLEERSWHAISIDDIARGAGISRPTFYFYFASKEAVLLSLFDRIVAEGRDSRGDALERLGDDPAAAIREVITAYVDRFGSHRAVTLAGAEASVSSPAVRELWSQIMEAWVAEATAAIEAERSRGRAPADVPARDLAVVLLRMNERVLQTTFSGESPAVDEDAAVETLVHVWLSAIYDGRPSRD
ncbi:MAG TPA: TetR/AcrR family transcriptional regulator [Solirubrobacteraceae bacterium]|nr:TetR/AcrR family transcriptional regulator [Solirubrobacteraceae bacterium]